jgi:transposase
MARKKSNQQAQKITKFDYLEQINLNAAGLDIDDDYIWAAVPTDRDEQSVRRFGTFTCDLHALCDWLVACGIETVAMESTGVLWIPLYELLEERGIEVCLVNAQATKNVSGRKNDVLDCQWIQQLHTYGLFQASFRPPADICTLRAYVRQRDMLIRYRSSHVQHMQKALQQMNLKLTNVIRDITGKTGMQIIRSILAGERDPVRLAQYRDYRCKKTEDEIAKSLEGNYQPEHIFSLRQAVELYDFYNQQIAACDAEIEQHYAVFEPQVDVLTQPLPPKPPNRRKHEPNYDLRTCLYQMVGVDLTDVDGLDVVLIQQILAEIGTDMHKWPSDKHFTAWLRLAPNNQISGGKVLRSNTKPTKSRANQAFRMAAQAVRHCDCALGAFYRRIKARQGAPKAVTATARKIATIVYHMIKDRRPYQDQGASHYEEQYKQRVIDNLRRKAKKLGLQLVPV